MAFSGEAGAGRVSKTHHIQSRAARIPVEFRCSGNTEKQYINDGTCGRRPSDSCAGVTAYCSVSAVGYDISCGGSDPLKSWCLCVHVRARFSRPARAKGFRVLRICRRVFELEVAAPVPGWPGATRKG